MMNDYTSYAFLCAVVMVAVGYLLCSLFSWSLNYDKWNKFSITLKNVLCWIGYVPIAFVTFLFVNALLLKLLNKLSFFFVLELTSVPESTTSFYLLENFKVIISDIFLTGLFIVAYVISAGASLSMGYVLCPSKKARVKSLPIAISITIFEVFNMIVLWHSSSIYGDVMSVIHVLLSIALCACFIEKKESVNAEEPETTSTSSSEQAYLLVFSASWCEPSKKFIKEINEAGINCYTYIDADQEWTEDLFTKYNVSSVPTTILVKTNGEVINKWFGYHGKDSVQSKFVSYIRNCNYSIVPFTKQDTL